ADSKTHVASMTGGDFYGSEKSVTMPTADTVKIELHGESGKVTVLKDSLKLLEGEIIDAATLSAKALREFLQEQKEDAKAQGVLFSLHMKATMMKVSDPIIFGHAVRVFFAPVFEKHAAVLEELGVDANNGFGDLVGALDKLSE